MLNAELAKVRAAAEGIPSWNPPMLVSADSMRLVFAKLDAVEAAVLAEREACAAICDRMAREAGAWDVPGLSASEAAAAIRARGQGTECG